MAPPLPEWPTELVEHIASYLPTTALLAFRTVCRDFNAKTFELFGKGHFRIRKFMLTTPSLQTMIAIAAHRSLGQYLKTLIIGTEYFASEGERRYRIMMRHDNQEEHSLLRMQHNAYRKHWFDQGHLRDYNGDVEMLTTALINLKHLKAIIITSRSSVRGHELTSWGLNAVRAEIGLHVPLHTLFSQFFIVVFAAITRSGVAFSELDVETSDTELLEEAFVEPSQAFSDLTTLSLDVERVPQRYVPLEEPTYLRQLLSSAPNLTKLTLTSPSSPIGFRAGVIFELAQHIRLPHLEQLSLSGGQAEGKDLCDLLVGHSCTLRKVHIESMDLVSGSWLSVFQTMQLIDRLQDIYLAYLTEKQEVILGNLKFSEGEEVDNGDEIPQFGGNFPIPYFVKEDISTNVSAMLSRLVSALS